MNLNAHASEPIEYASRSYGNARSPKYSPNYCKDAYQARENPYPYTNPSATQNPSRSFGIDLKGSSIYKNSVYDR